MHIDRQQDMGEYNGDLWEVAGKQQASTNLQQIVVAIAIAGVLIGMNALAYFVFRKIDVDLWGADKFILAVAWAGFELAMISALFLFFRKHSNAVQLERNHYLAIASEFLSQWTRFELLGQSKLKSMSIEFNPWSVREMIQKLVAANVLNADHEAMIEEALRTRNVLVHGRAEVDAVRLTRITDRLREIAKRLGGE